MSMYVDVCRVTSVVSCVAYVVVCVDVGGVLFTYLIVSLVFYVVLSFVCRLFHCVSFCCMSIVFTLFYVSSYVDVCRF